LHSVVYYFPSDWAGPFPLGGPSALWTEPGCTVLFIIFHLIQFNSNSNLV
jgi:hypothetical protein